MNSFLLIGFAPEAADDSVPNAPAGGAADTFFAVLTDVQKQLTDQRVSRFACRPHPQ